MKLCTHIRWADLLLSLVVTAALGWFWLAYVEAPTEDVHELKAMAGANQEAHAYVQALLRVNPTPSHGELIAIRLTLNELLNPTALDAPVVQGGMKSVGNWLRAYGPLVGVFLFVSTGLSLFIARWRRLQSKSLSS